MITSMINVNVAVLKQVDDDVVIENDLADIQVQGALPIQASEGCTQEAPAR